MGTNICYLRTSTLEQEPELQIRDINSTYPNIIFSTYSEQQSAYKDNVLRPEFNRIMELIKKGQVDNLYVWDLDRVYRNRLKLKEFFFLCKTKKTKIHSVNQQWLESINQIPEPFNEMVNELLINIFGWIGEEESTKKSKRVKMAVVKKDGKRTKSYKGNFWGRKPLPKQTIDRVLSLKEEGLSIRKISEQVTIYDKNKNGRNISKSAVHKILQQNNH